MDSVTESGLTVCVLEVVVGHWVATYRAICRSFRRLLEG